MQNSIFDISIEYCASWGYTSRAVSLADEVLSEREVEVDIRSLKLIPSSGGVFKVMVNDDVVFSKKEVGRHAEEGEAKAAIVKAMKASKSE